MIVKRPVAINQSFESDPFELLPTAWPEVSIGVRKNWSQAMPRKRQLKAV